MRVVKQAAAKATQLLLSNQQWVKTQQQRLKLRQQKDEEARKWLNWLVGIVGRSANAWLFFIAWGVVAGAWGWFGGINTPVSIICSTQDSLCYQARLRGMKLAITDLPKPQCTLARKGLMCLVPEPKHSTSQKSRTHH